MRPLIFDEPEAATYVFQMGHNVQLNSILLKIMIVH